MKKKLFLSLKARSTLSRRLFSSEAKGVVMGREDWQKYKLKDLVYDIEMVSAGFRKRWAT